MAKAGCVFCDIVAVEADALVVDERDGGEGRAGTLAFSPLDPIGAGHVLVVPKAHHETLFDVPEDVLVAVTTHVRSLAKRMRRDSDQGFDGVNVLNDSTSYQSVPHLHVHVVGRYADDDDLFPTPDHDVSKRDAHDAVVSALDSP